MSLPFLLFREYDGEDDDNGDDDEDDDYAKNRHAQHLVSRSNKPVSTPVQINWNELVHSLINFIQNTKRSKTN